MWVGGWISKQYTCIKSVLFQMFGFYVIIINNDKIIYHPTLRNFAILAENVNKIFSIPFMCMFTLSM